MTRMIETLEWSNIFDEHPLKKLEPDEMLPTFKPTNSRLSFDG